MTEIWSFPTRVVFGVGSCSQLGLEAQRLGLSRVLIVTDPGVIAAGLIEGIQAALHGSGICAEVFSELSSNPFESEVEAAAAAYRQAAAQGVVAVGGGAAMDVGKLVVVRVSTERPFAELDDALGGDQFIPQQLPPIIAVPTTAGTGSEVGRAAVLTVASTGVKTVVFAPSLLPSVALLDPELTKSLPAGATAATGFDALSHCVEAYLAKGDHPMADAIALGGIELVAKYLVRAVQNGLDLEARGALMKAATMGAVAFQKGLGACHSLSHPLGAVLGMHHGLANALCLAAVVDFNEQEVPDRVATIGALLGSGPGLGNCGRRLRVLKEQCKLPSGLASQNVGQNQLATLASLALRDGCHAQNPRVCTEQDFLKLYTACL